MCAPIMTHSSMRAMRVAMAAPFTPSAGAPKLPKMSTQFKKVLHSMELIRIYMPSFGRSMERYVAT